jgi:hypothetical protein
MQGYPPDSSAAAGPERVRCTLMLLIPRALAVALADLLVIDSLMHSTGLCIE